jgi:ribose transport system ATP-binding protein
MRDGKYITQMPYDINRMDEIIANMVGHEIKEKFPRVSCEKGKKILEVKHLNAGRMVRDINLELYEGEIVGIAGLMGAGRTETARALFGADPIDSGDIYINGKKVDIKSPEDAVRNGIGYLSEDRKRYGIVVQKSVAENTSMATMEQFMKGIFIDKKKEKEVAQQHVPQK